jgi:hypothetical protein
MNSTSTKSNRAPRGPRLLEPVTGRPLTVVVAYANRASAERQVKYWNTMVQIDGFEVTVGPRDDNGEWPLIWTAV